MRTFIAVILGMSFSAFAAAPPRGGDQLRNLVVFPEMSLNFFMGIGLEGNQVVITGNNDATFEISQLGKQLKLDPDNSGALLRLGYLLDSNNDTNGSRVCYQKAAKICREKAAANPEDTIALDNLGEALSGLGRNDEAEVLYRKATQIAPSDWRCWVNLGNYLPWNSVVSMFPENIQNQLSLGTQPPQAVLDYRPSPASLEKAENALTESSRDFDKAMAIAPKEADIYLQRAGYMMISNWVNCLFRSYRGKEKPDPSEWTAPEFSQETIANIERAAELSPENADYTGLAAFFDWMAAVIKTKSGNPTLEALPEATRQPIDNAIARLEKLSQNPDEHVAAAALEYLGALNLMFGNSQSAASQLRRAVALDPMRPQSWNILLGAIMNDADFPDEAISICKSRLKYVNSVQNHLFLAKAYRHKNEWSQATGEAEIAADMDTNNVITPILLVAIDLKQSDNADFLPKASEQLDRAGVLLGRMGSAADSWKRWREICLDTAIYDGLQGTPDFEKSARQSLDQVLKYYPNDETAKAILEALPGENPSAEAQGD